MAATLERSDLNLCLQSFKFTLVFQIWTEMWKQTQLDKALYWLIEQHIETADGFNPMSLRSSAATSDVQSWV